jgi:hypothetical protein
VWQHRSEGAVHLPVLLESNQRRIVPDNGPVKVAHLQVAPAFRIDSIIFPASQFEV